jgi:hypothetical protein
MSNLLYSPDKELENVTSRSIASHPEETREAKKLASIKQNVFLIALLWIAWIVAVIFDTMLEIDRRYWALAQMSPLQKHVYRKEWDLWVYKVSVFHVNFPVRRKTIEWAVFWNVLYMGVPQHINYAGAKEAVSSYSPTISFPIASIQTTAWYHISMTHNLTDIA